MVGTRVPRPLPRHGAAAAWTGRTEAPSDLTSFPWTRGYGLCVTMATCETREKERGLDWLIANYAEPGSERLYVPIPLH